MLDVHCFFVVVVAVEKSIISYKVLFSVCKCMSLFHSSLGRPVCFYSVLNVYCSFSCSVSPAGALLL